MKKLASKLTPRQKSRRALDLPTRAAVLLSTIDEMAHIRAASMIREAEYLESLIA